MTESRPAAHFSRLYQLNPDPWRFETSAYEQDKYRRTIAALDHRRFAAGLEVGCSIGFLTRMLAEQCDTLLGVDIVEEPLQAARQRCAELTHVHFARMRVPSEWPDGRFDLIVFSEVLYFLSGADIDRCVARIRDCLSPGGTVVLVNWLGETDDPTPGDQAAERFIAASGGALVVGAAERNERYRLDVLHAV
jgi:2-polyprenyl-3-methyl-5-hydroxy-6-metoxy-1,4-benzoquinol methylase